MDKGKKIVIWLEVEFQRERSANKVAKIEALDAKYHQQQQSDDLIRLRGPGKAASAFEFSS